MAAKVSTLCFWSPEGGGGVNGVAVGIGKFVALVELQVLLEVPAGTRGRSTVQKRGGAEVHHWQVKGDRRIGPEQQQKGGVSGE